MLAEDFLKDLQRTTPDEFKMTTIKKWNDIFQWSEDNRFCEKGYQAQFGRYYFSYVIYQYGMLSLGRFAFGIGLSFDFSGCLMASFKYKDKHYLSHIAVDDRYDGRLDFQNFMQQNDIGPNDFNIFKPCTSDKTCFRSWGLITKAGDCYSIGVDPFKNKIVKYEKTSSMPIGDKIQLCQNNIALNSYRWSNL